MFLGNFSQIKQRIIDSFNNKKSNIDLEKAYEEGLYADTPTNRKLGRVGQPYSYKEESKPVEKIKGSGSESEALKYYENLTQTNAHGAAALFLAEGYGTKEEVEKIKSINETSNKRGNITKEEQIERDAITNKIYNKLKEDSSKKDRKEPFKVTEPKGHKIEDAIDYGKKLVDRGIKTIQLREEIEKNYPGLKDNHSDIINKILEHREKNIEANTSDSVKLNRIIDEANKKKVVGSGDDFSAKLRERFEAQKTKIDNIGKEENTSPSKKQTAKELRDSMRVVEAEVTKYENLNHHYMQSGDTIKAAATKKKMDLAQSNLSKLKKQWFEASKEESKRDADRSQNYMVNNSRGINPNW